MSADARIDPAAAPPERGMHELGPDELLIVGAFRAWAAPHLQPGAPHPDWREMFRLAGLAVSGTVGFEILMCVLGAQAQRLLEVRCCDCPSVGPDEAALLRLVAALQAGGRQEALEVLGEWLPDDAIGPALRGASRFAAVMAGAGFRLTDGGRRRVPATVHRLH